MTTFFLQLRPRCSSSSLLAALAVGSSVGYPSVLLQQLSSNDTTIQLDWDTASWIGSIHGIAGIPSLIMPVFIQWQGRRLGFILACLISIIGWILSYSATSSTFLLISESFNGFGTQCISATILFSMSEMLCPQFRKMILGLYTVMQSTGVMLIQFAGNYLHWKTISLIVSGPLIVAVIATSMWPESPSWLAYKGKFDKCETAFKRLRGTGDLAQAELEELILAQKESLSGSSRRQKQSSVKSLWPVLKRRDFYLPNLHIFVLLLLAYWSGCMAHIIYAAEIIERATHSKDAIFYGSMSFNSSMVICCIIGTFVVKFVDPKRVLLVCVSCIVVCLLSASAINYCQNVGLMVKESYICLYFLIAYMFAFALIFPIVVPLTSELMPVKHRGVAGPLYSVIIPCILHTSSLKLVPYMLFYMNLWGMLLVFAANAMICTLYTWKYIPETKGRTLQQLEDYYNYGNFDKCRRIDMENALSGMMPREDDDIDLNNKLHT